MKYEVGDKVRIKSLDWYNENVDEYDEVPCGSTDFIPDMTNYCDKIVTISKVLQGLKVYRIQEDNEIFNWTDEMIEGLVEEDVDLIPKFGEFSDNEPLDIPTMTTDFIKEYGLPCPEGYIFKDEHGNIINARKIVLEKKKKEYPKTYEECCEILEDVADCSLSCFACGLLNNLQKLLLCRDAYWQIAGEEMGLGKPWEPDWVNLEQDKHCIWVDVGDIILNEGYRCQHILTFPTEEMRDAFYENFKELIESVKELL